MDEHDVENHAEEVEGQIAVAVEDVKDTRFHAAVLLERQVEFGYAPLKREPLAPATRR